MDISDSCQIDMDELVSLHFDVMILGYSGHERWNWLLQKIQNNVNRKILLLFEDANDLFSGFDQLNLFNIQGLEIVRLQSSDSPGIESLVNKLIGHANDDEFRILIDYSSMSRPWYSSVIKTLLNTDLSGEGKLMAYFVSLPPTYFDPPEIFEVRDHGSITHPAFHVENRKVAMIIGLGYEGKPAYKLVNKLKPDQLFLFYADPHFHPKFVNNVLDINKKLIRQAGDDHLIPYPVQDMEKTDHLVTALILKLRLTHHIIIVPMGPKVFAVNSLLIQSRFPDIEVWEAGSEAWINANHIGVSGNPLIYKVVFSED